MPRKVTHIVESMKPEAGSPACLLPGLFEHQRSRGWSVDVVCREDLDRAEEHIESADLIHVHGLWSPLTKALWPILRRAGRPYILSTYGMALCRPHHSGPVRRALASLTYQRQLIRDAACLHALTERESEWLRRKGYHRRIKVLPMGVTPAATETHDGAPRGRSVLYLGPLQAGEGVLVLLRAFSAAMEKHSEVQCTLAGFVAPGWRSLFESSLRRQGLPDRVHLIGSPDSDQMTTALAQASVVVEPLRRARCPVSALFAMAMGKPVLVSPTCHLPDVQRRGAGWVAAPHLRPIREALLAALALDPAELQAIGARGRTIVTERLSWDRLGPEYVHLYARVLAKTGQFSRSC